MISLIYSFSQGIDENILAIITTVIEFIIVVMYVIYKATPTNSKINKILSYFFKVYSTIKNKKEANSDGENRGNSEEQNGGNSEAERGNSEGQNGGNSEEQNGGN